MVMPGFRFHPTEEELVEFYLRRKVEGKPFNVELITFLDLYSYDPWELPGLAAIGEKEWYFYVPRDRKYKNGDRPNRVTKSGYWKATGADRTIRGETNLMPIGLKKTLVFYSGKAPRGIRTTWIMNEYRLPLHETQRLLHKASEIAICRVYKRPGVATSSPSPRPLQQPPQSKTTCMMNLQQRSYIQTSTTAYGGSSWAGKSSRSNPQIMSIDTLTSVDQVLEEDDHSMMLLQSKQAMIANNPMFGSSSSSNVAADDLHKLVNYNISDFPHNDNLHRYAGNAPAGFLQPPAAPPPEIVPPRSTALFGDRFWDWNAISDASCKDFLNPFQVKFDDH
ncbi:NAC domain-containing protein 35-like isoform X2 [Andrographis paniculata]|nr:NAC domain-containing protein 35-like isoform X2 [Andrographis paniculata]